MVGCGRCCQLRRNARGFPVSGDQKQAQPIPDAPVPWLQQSPWATPQPAVKIRASRPVGSAITYLLANAADFGGSFR